MRVYDLAVQENAGKTIRIHCGEYSITRTAENLIADTDADILNETIIKVRTSNKETVIHAYLYPKINRHKLFNKVMG